MGDTKRIREPKHLYLLPLEQRAAEESKRMFIENGGVLLTDQDREIFKRFGFEID